MLSPFSFLQTFRGGREENGENREKRVADGPDESMLPLLYILFVLACF